jgi:hypothetical protein
LAKAINYLNEKKNEQTNYNSVAYNLNKLELKPSR